MRRTPVPRDQYQVILRLRDGGMPPAELASRYNVGVRNIYIICDKARAEAGAPVVIQADPAAEARASSAVRTVADAGVEQPAATPPETPVVTLAEEMAAVEETIAVEDVSAVLEPATEAAPSADPVGVTPVAPVTEHAAETPIVAAMGRKAASVKDKQAFAAKTGIAPVPASSAKQAFGLVSRSEEGDETVLPFPSLDDLLASARGVLRNAARSPETVWFTIRPVDLNALES